VTIDGVGDLPAIGPAAARPEPGEQVRLRLDRAATAVIGSAVINPALVR